MLAAQLCESVVKTKRGQGCKIRAVILVWWIFHSRFSCASQLCTFHQEKYEEEKQRAFNHLAHEEICDPLDKEYQNIRTTPCNNTTYHYWLNIPVRNATNCGVRLRDPDGDETELTQPAECGDFFSRTNGTTIFPMRGPLCLDMWFMNNYDSYVTVSYITTDRSGLPGRYEVELQNGEIQSIPLVRSPVGL